MIISKPATANPKTEVTLGDVGPPRPSKVTTTAHDAKPKVVQLPPAPDPSTDRPLALDWRLRAVYFFMSTVASGFGVFSLVDDSTEWAWTSLLWWMFSQVCSHIVSYSNPRGPTTTRVAILSGFLVALPGILAGAKLSVSGDITEKWFGYCSMTFGAFFAIVLPISFPMMVKEYAKLSKRRQHEFIVGNLLKGSASILGSLIYISAAASRCIQRADDDGNLLSQCGNPIIPSFVLTIFLFWTWLLTVLVPPLVTSLRVTWDDIARLSLPENLVVQGSIYAVMSLSALIMFAQLNEDGEKINSFILYDMMVFVVATSVLLFSVLYAEMCGKRAQVRRSSTSSRFGADMGAEEDQERVEQSIRDVAFSIV
mmetsp:Transcript_3209/g.6738  ORF Transcript_3209/g.6738 Transcript_3209/m.6738 type:complete len:368 (-) Transcript_3209:75-1178(-)